jgi:Adenylate and Guanylate cyclase catalytic domain
VSFHRPGIVYCGTVGNETRREYAAVGDVVNLAARLMSKADGEILVDEKTYSRLPDVIHKKLTKRPPMIVKGKEKPIVTYLFDSRHTVQADGRLASTLVDDVIDEELPIRQICRDAFAGPLLYLTSDTPLKHVQFLVLEGRLGTGREEAALWLKRHCNTKHLRIIPVNLSKADATVSYKALAKIFRLLIREENFDDIGRQTFVVNTLLRQMYPKDVDTREKVAYPTMRRALGVTCPLKTGPNRGHGPKSGPEGDLDFDPLNHPSFVDTLDSKIPIRHMGTTVKEILLTLCKDQPVVILIEEAQNLDESSWRILVSLLKVKAKVFFVLTEEPIDYLVSVFKTAGSDSSIGELIFPDSNILYDWIPPYLKKLTFDKKSSYILLPEFTFSEVRSYLAATLKLSQWQLPSGLDNVVYNLCGGSPYW